MTLIHFVQEIGWRSSGIPKTPCPYNMKHLAKYTDQFMDTMVNSVGCGRCIHNYMKSRIVLDEEREEGTPRMLLCMYR